MKRHIDVVPAEPAYGVRRDWVLELAALRQEDSMVRDMLTVWTVPVFPVNGDDLLALGYKPGGVLGDTLRYLKMVWAESDYHMTREELLAKLGVGKPCLLSNRSCG